MAGREYTVMAERLAFAQEVWASTFDRPKAERKIADRYGISRTQARRYLRAIKRVAAIRANEEGADSFADLIARLEHLYELAMNRTRTIERKKAGLYGGYEIEYEEVPDPNITQATRLLERLADFRGLSAQREVSLTVRAVPPSPAEAIEASRKLRLLGGGEK